MLSSRSSSPLITRALSNVDKHPLDFAKTQLFQSSSEEYDQLRETLSIDEDDPEMFGETVREKLLQIYAQAASQ